MTLIAVIDSETSDLGDEASVIELAAVHVPFPSYDVPCGCDSWLFSPHNGKPVAPTASAIHHLVDADLAGRPPFSLAAWELAIFDADYIAAHNVAFDRGVVERAIGRTEKPWLCTMKLARAAWPEAPSHGNQALRYWLGLRGPEPLTHHAHRAGYDALVTSWLLKRLLTHYGEDLERMVKISGEPSLLTMCRFGKHAGTRWSEIPRDYLRWMLDKGGFDEDTTHTARYHYERGL